MSIHFKKLKDPFDIIFSAKEMTLVGNYSTSILHTH